MKIKLIAAENIVKTAQELTGFGFSLEENGVRVKIEEGERFSVCYTDGGFLVKIQKRVQAFYAIKYLSDNFSKLPQEGYEKNFLCAFDNLTYMLDCSRNAVPKNGTVFELVRYLAVMGYNSLGLYMEDTFTVKNQPYFGYLRTPFTADDLRAIDAYCAQFGIELVPYIQTLAHFNSLQRHYALDSLFDVNDILLVGDEKVYAFLEDLISTCSSCFTTRRIHIGMDEAYMLGRGKYQDLNGAQGRFAIMQQHLRRVLDICRKYGLKPAMWSDMFFTLSLSGQYGSEMPQEVLDCVPAEIELDYWDYGSISEEHYDTLIQKHQCFPNKIGFAAGAWKWLGFTPDNRFAFASCEAAARACIKRGIRDYIVTGWGDNGAECSTFAVLPALLYCSKFDYDDFGLDGNFERSFYSLSGMPLTAFMAIDLGNRVTENDDVEEKNSANKYLLYNDVLLGTLDTTLEKGLGELYGRHAKTLRNSLRVAGKWAYLFKTQLALCRVLQIKADLGVRLREAYKAQDKAALAECLEDLKLLPLRINVLYKEFRSQWEKENRPFGFDVQDLRIGALLRRVQTAIEKVGDYLAGKTDSVPELQEELLDFLGHGKDFEIDNDQCEWRWRRMSSVNVNE